MSKKQNPIDKQPPHTGKVENPSARDAHCEGC